MANPSTLKQEFTAYARTCILSRRPSNKDNFILGQSAADSYVSFVEVDKLFSYNPNKWGHIKSIFDIDKSETIKEIYLQLIHDEEFNRVDNEGTSQYFRSNAIKQYYCFLKARELFQEASAGLINTEQPIDKQQEKAIKPASTDSRQQIFYGAPGTGKSHAVNKLTIGESVIRTTFHPDSDYSTFVGAYKPTMKIMPITDESGKTITIGNTTLQKEQIVYEFVEQAFLQAYIQAWKYYTEQGDEIKKQYLIIEEINRGNCAQIFGDLFQLLDRNDYGFSVYPIHANKDIKACLEKQFKDLNLENLTWTNEYFGRDIAADIKIGDILVLPSNLYIWATMNTSDQSLFPIDSAFKRRWDWKYEPIKYNNTGWAIEIGDIQYSWASFQRIVNNKIYEDSHSEDKMLGDFFVKPYNNDNVITCNQFRNKVLFYLWNDVCKDSDVDVFKANDKDDILFSELHGEGGISLLHAMMAYLGVEVIKGNKE